MSRPLAFVVAIWSGFAPLAFPADANYASCLRKFEEIRLGRVKAGAVYLFTPAEINAYARTEAPLVVPQGLREPRVELGTDVVTGYALVDFQKMQHSKGAKTNFLLSKLIEGERPVVAMVEVQSAKGRATAFLRRFEISKVRASGSVLDFLVSTFFRPLYPEAHINEPWEIGYNVDRINVRPDGVRVYIAQTLKPLPKAAPTGKPLTPKTPPPVQTPRKAAPPPPAATKSSIPAKR